MNNQTKRFGIIGGNGWLGTAMADAAVATGLIATMDLTLSAQSSNRGTVDIPGAYWTRDNAELVKRSDIIVLSVHPEQFADVAIDARGKLIVSVMAGISAAAISARTGSSQIIRTMPNAAAAIRRSFTPWFAGASVLNEERDIVHRFLETFGGAAEVPTEHHLDYCAGLTGSGAAFPSILAQAMIRHAMGQGLSEEFARRAAEGIVVHAAQLLARRPQRADRGAGRLPRNDRCGNRGHGWTGLCGHRWPGPQYRAAKSQSMARFVL